MLRQKAGFPLLDKEVIHLLRSMGKLALPWQQEDVRLRWDFKDKQAKLFARFVRKDVNGNLVAEVRQLGVSAEWVAVDFKPGSRSPEKARAAASAWEAFIDADAHLEASDWRLLGAVVLVGEHDDA